MTTTQRRALAPLLTRIGEALKDYELLGDEDHCSPAIYLNLRQWKRILEEFGTP